MGQPVKARSALTSVAPVTGDYDLLATNYFGHVALGDGILGDYQVRATGVALDDHADLIASATPLVRRRQPGRRRRPAERP